MKTLLFILTLALSLFAFAQNANQAAHKPTEKEILEKFKAEGVPEHGLKKMLEYRSRWGATYVQDIYTCEGKDPADLKPCDEKKRIKGTRTVTIPERDLGVIIDFTKSSLDKRYFLLNFKTGEVQKFQVTHGKGSGSLYAYKFSNTQDSQQTSLGMYVTGLIYKSDKFGPTLRMYGLEKSNDHAYTRDIVMHGAWYADETFPSKKNDLTGKPYGRLGVSWGCPAVSFTNAKKIFKAIENGVLVYHDHADLAEQALNGREVIGPDPEKAVQH